MRGGKPAPESILPLGRRRLTTEEEHLWSLVVRTVRPLRQSKKPATVARHRAGIRDMARSVKKRAAVDAEGLASRQRDALASTLPPLMRREKHQPSPGPAAIDAPIDLPGTPPTHGP